MKRTKRTSRFERFRKVALFFLLVGVTVSSTLALYYTFGAGAVRF